MEASESRKSFSVFTSAVLHALFIALLIWFFNLEKKPPEGNEAIDVTTVSKEQNAKPKSVKQPKVSTAPVNHSTKHGERMVSLSDLGMRLDRNPQPVASSENSLHSQPEAEDSPDEGWDVLNPDPKLARFNQYIYNTVQGWLDRDAYMNHQQLYGQVKVRLWFSADGEWLEDETTYDAVDPDFIRIVQRALRKSFTNPIPKPFLFKHEKFSIVRTVVVRT